MQGEQLARVLAGEATAYDRGVWFNSAKFLDLEYQTYGLVKRDVPGEKNLYWQADDGLHALRVVYTDESVIGFNALGIRYRHKICERVEDDQNTKRTRLHSTYTVVSYAVFWF